MKDKINGAKVEKPRTALAGIRVVDMSGWSGQYCGKQFADLGAEVIIVEPIEGSSVRRDGPFVDGKAGLERSIPFAYYNAGKRSIAIDLDNAEGQSIFRRLIRNADLLIESEKPGVMASRGLDFASLSKEAPKLVMTSITPFGQTGPYANYESEDIVTLALGGLLYLGGYADMPTAVHGNQAYLSAAQFASVASMMGLLAVEAAPGAANGKQIDVSVQECVVMGLETAIQFYDLEKSVRTRGTGQLSMAGVGVFGCVDGEIYLMAGGIASTRFWENTANWLIEEDVAEAAQLLDKKWNSHDYLATPEAKRIFNSLFQPFAAKRTKLELYEAGQAKRIPICPVCTPKDILESRQLAYRNFFVSQRHEQTGRLMSVPGAPYRLTATPWMAAGPSPRLGEHTADILSELGYDAAARAALLKLRVIN
ncbi:CaiB/BaiF CoA transferase family protein [Bradyrhizobium genosp. P]|uniref:CaiB/BaiF CoA transferase family protein n=1 Tax=Bradyrhizobium genosp. P TaxID=83641 RepID=UPI003CEECEC6